MKRKLVVVLLAFIFSHNGLFAQVNGPKVFLSLASKSKVILYKDSLLTKAMQTIGHNMKDEDYILFTLMASSCRGYYVEASFAIAGSIGRGWISKKTNLGVFSRAYSRKFFVYNLPDRKAIRKTLNYTSDELKIVDFKKNGWLKVQFKQNGKNIEGWIPPEDQCNSPYTTCS